MDTTDSSAQFVRLLQASIKVVADFGAALETRHPEDGFGPLRSETHLPHSRKTILYALGLLHTAIADADQRAIIMCTLPAQEVQFLFSEQYSRSLASCRSLLDTYVPDPALDAQRKLAADTASILASLGADEQQRFLDRLPSQAQEVLAALRKPLPGP